MINVAKNIYGRCSEEARSVTNAWNAVGVGSEWENPEYDLLMTYDQDCNAVTLTVRDLNTWEPITWVTTNGLLINGNSSPYSGYGGSVTISSPNGLGGVISAIIGDACSTTYDGLKKLDRILITLKFLSYEKVKKNIYS